MPTSSRIAVFPFQPTTHPGSLPAISPTLAVCVADIFISYSSRQRELTRALAAAIEARFGTGSVWWDQAGLRAGDRFSPEITAALDAARAVVVVWTTGAVASDWVYAEAVRAAAQRKIVTVQADDLDPKLIPLPFNVFHTCLAGDTPALLDGIAKMLEGEASSLPSALPGEGFRDFLLDPRQEALPARAIARRPASLLLAKHRLVPFDDIHGLRAEFVAWATGTPAHAMGSPVLGRLVHAPAGLGKTRALIEIADELVRRHGWLAGFVPRDVRGAGRESSERVLERLILGGGDAAGLMLVVDYAESRQDDVVWLADRLLRRAESVARPARLVLLSRGAGEWWRELLRKSQSLQDLCSLGGDRYDEIEIPEEIARVSRRALFDASVEAFQSYRNVVAASAGELGLPSVELLRALDSEDDYDRPLAVQIAALLHVAGVDASQGSDGTAGLLKLILGLEEDYWGKALKIDQDSNWRVALKHGVAQLTLVGHVDSSQRADELVGSNPLYGQARDIDVPRVRTALSRLFPGVKEGLVGLEPDLVGEHHVAEVATNALVDACLAWAGEDRTPRQHILTVLNRATRKEHGAEAAARAEEQLSRLVRTRAAALGGDLVRVAVETPGRLLELCPALETQLAVFEESELAAIHMELPLQSLKLMGLSRAVAARRVDLAREAAAEVDALNDLAPDRSEGVLRHLAAQLGTLGIRLAHVGRREEALNASQEAVDIFRRLAATQADVFLPDLAKTLNNLGVRLSALGCREKALTASRETVDIFRSLAATRGNAFLPNLAMSLNNLGTTLSDLGRKEEALAASREAVDTYRRLAAQADTFAFALAGSLHNLGNRLSDVHRLEEALAASQEAVSIRRRLTETRPDSFQPDLANSLNDLGVHLSNLGRHEEALVTSREAVDIHRRLAGARPDAFQSDLATSLNNLGNPLSKLGRHEEALAAIQEAVDIRKRLAKTRPDAFLPAVAMSLGSLGAVLGAGHRHGESAASFHEGLLVIAPFVERHAQAFNDLAGNLQEDYSAACERAGLEPDAALLDRVLRVLRRGGAGP